MNLKNLAKYKIDLFLLVVILGTLLSWFSLDSIKFFWFLSFIILISAFFIAISFFKVKFLETFKSTNLYDILFFAGVVFVFNANIVLIPNVFILIPLLIVYFFALKYLLQIIRKDASTQAKKNTFILAIILALFFGGNFLTTVYLNIGTGNSGLLLLAITIILFAYTYGISQYNFAKNNFEKVVSKTYSSVLALLIAETFVIFSFLSEKYPNIVASTETAPVISISTVSLFFVLIYYCVWGLMIHKMEEKINFRIIFEYVGIAIVIAATILLTIKWF